MTALWRAPSSYKYISAEGRTRSLRLSCRSWRLSLMFLPLCDYYSMKLMRGLGFSDPHRFGRRLEALPVSSAPRRRDQIPSAGAVPSEECSAHSVTGSCDRSAISRSMCQVLGKGHLCHGGSKLVIVPLLRGHVIGTLDF